MGCLCRDEQIVELNGRTIVLKGVRESFRYVRLVRGRNPTPDVGLELVKALRDVGNNIPPGEEVEYGRMLAEMFAVYCSIEPAVGCR